MGRLCVFFCRMGMAAVPLAFLGAITGAAGRGGWVSGVGLVLCVGSLVAVVLAVIGAIVTDALDG